LHILDAPEKRAGWVLAGGRSSRMGTDKALVEIGGVPLVLLVAGQVAKVCESVSLVGDPARYGSWGLRVVPDAFPGQGPLAGIEAALGATSAELNLVVACDMPALHPDTFEALFADLGDDDIALPQYADGRLEPLCAVYRRRCHPAVRQALEAGVRKVTDAFLELESHGFALRYVRVANHDTFANLNTPGDLSEWVERGSKGQHG
jgi:molybdopterin-guanine dinucleotide biosynthesis protein A